MKFFLCSVCVIALSAAFIGCMKSTPIEPAKPVSYVSVMNLSLKAPAVEMLFNNAKVTPPIGPGAYFNRYSQTDPEVKTVSFKKAGSDSLVAEIAPGQLYDSNSFYTILLYDKPAGGSAAARIRDVFPTVDPTKTYFRFFQLSADVPEVDLFFENTKIFSARQPADNITSTSFNQFQPYQPNIYSIKAKLAGTDSLIASTNYSDLLAGGIYTIFLKGVKGGQGNSAFGIELLRAAN